MLTPVVGFVPPAILHSVALISFLRITSVQSLPSIDLTLLSCALVICAPSRIASVRSAPSKSTDCLVLLSWLVFRERERGNSERHSSREKEKKSLKNSKTCLEVGVPQVRPDEARAFTEAPKHVCSFQVGLVEDGASEDALVELLARKVLARKVLEGGLLELALISFFFFFFLMRSRG